MQGLGLATQCRSSTWRYQIVSNFKVSLKGILHLLHYRANILLDCNFIAKLGDFGFAQELPKVTPGRTLVTMKSVAKTPGYSAPELDTRHQSHKTDMFSYGVVSIIISYRIAMILCLFRLLWNPYLRLNPMMKRGRTALW